MSFNTRVQQIQAFYQQRRRMPSFREIAAITGLRSKNAVSKLVRKMIMHELIAQDAQGRLISRLPRRSPSLCGCPLGRSISRPARHG